jgi:hypothetical protein
MFNCYRSYSRFHVYEVRPGSIDARKVCSEDFSPFSVKDFHSSLQTSSIVVDRPDMILIISLIKQRLTFMWCRDEAFG